jgi:excisionase family DNA binding protein
VTVGQTLPRGPLLCTPPVRRAEGGPSGAGKQPLQLATGGGRVRSTWSRQVADLLYVSPMTVSRWAKEGKLPFLKTLGGHRRFPEAEIRELAEGLREEAIT